MNYRWMEVPVKYFNIGLDEFVVMPNHIHGIIFVGATLAVAQNNSGKSSNYAKRAGARPAPTIGEIIGTFKSLCVYGWLKYIKENKIDTIGKFWQRNYYEHIIRNEDDLNRVREYIIGNPLKWDTDEENPKNKKTERHISF